MLKCDVPVAVGLVGCMVIFVLLVVGFGRSLFAALDSFGLDGWGLGWCCWGLVAVVLGWCCWVCIRSGGCLTVVCYVFTIVPWCVWFDVLGGVLLVVAFANGVVSVYLVWWAVACFAGCVGFSGLRFVICLLGL